MRDNFEIFSDNLKTLRKFYNMKQEELAQKSEIPRSNLSYYETGKSEPTLSALINISNLFDISINDLVKIELTIEILMKREKNKTNDSNKKLFKSTKIFSQKLKKLRLKEKLNQKELEDKIGVSGISFYESKNREPQLSSILKICSFFNISIDDLVSENIEIYKFTQDEIEFFKKVDFDYESIGNDEDFLNLLYNLKKYYLKRSEKLTDLIKVQIPSRIKEIDSIIEFMKEKENK